MGLLGANLCSGALLDSGEICIAKCYSLPLWNNPNISPKHSDLRKPLRCPQSSWESPNSMLKNFSSRSQRAACSESGPFLCCAAHSQWERRYGAQKSDLGTRKRSHSSSVVLGKGWRCWQETTKSPSTFLGMSGSPRGSDSHWRRQRQVRNRRRYPGVACQTCPQRKKLWHHICNKEDTALEGLSPDLYVKVWVDNSGPPRMSSTLRGCHSSWIINLLPSHCPCKIRKDRRGKRQAPFAGQGMNTSSSFQD